MKQKQKALYLAATQLAMLCSWSGARSTYVIYFTDRTHGTVTGIVIPPVRKSTHGMHAELIFTIAVRLCSIPVAVAHWRHCIGVRVIWSHPHSPDERRTTSGIYALAGRPNPVSSPIAALVASSSCQCWLLKYSTFQQMLYITVVTVLSNRCKLVLLKVTVT